MDNDAGENWLLKNEGFSQFFVFGNTRNGNTDEDT